MPSVIRCPRHWSTALPSLVKWMPTFVPSSFSSTISDASARKRRGLGLAEVLVVVGPPGAEEVGGPGVLHELAV